MKVGISTATFFTKLLTEDSFSVIQQCGGETSEVFLTTYTEYEPAFGKMLSQRKGALDVYSVHSCNTQYEPQLFNSAERTRSDAENIFRKVLTVGKLLGAKCYTLHGIARLKRDSVIDTERFGKRLEQLCGVAGEYGIRLCLENVHWASFNTPEFFAEVKKFAPDAGAVLDVKQARQSGRDWREYLDVMGERLCNVHISDVDQNGKIALVGKGVFPYGELVSRLADTDYPGPLIIEQYAQNYDSANEVAEAVEYIKNLIGGIYAAKI